MSPLGLKINPYQERLKSSRKVLCIVPSAPPKVTAVTTDQDSLALPGQYPIGLPPAPSVSTNWVWDARSLIEDWLLFVTTREQETGTESFFAQVLSLPHALNQTFERLTIVTHSLPVGIIQHGLPGPILRFGLVDINPFAEQAMVIPKGTRTQPVSILARLALRESI